MFVSPDVRTYQLIFGITIATWAGFAVALRIRRWWLRVIVSGPLFAVAALATLLYGLHFWGPHVRVSQSPEWLVSPDGKYGANAEFSRYRGVASVNVGANGSFVSEAAYSGGESSLSDVQITWLGPDRLKIRYLDWNRPGKESVCHKNVGSIRIDCVAISRSGYAEAQRGDSLHHPMIVPSYETLSYSAKSTVDLDDQWLRTSTGRRAYRLFLQPIRAFGNRVIQLNLVLQFPGDAIGKTNLLATMTSQNKYEYPAQSWSLNDFVYGQQSNVDSQRTISLTPIGVELRVSAAAGETSRFDYRELGRSGISDQWERLVLRVYVHNIDRHTAYNRSTEQTSNY